MEPYNAFLTNSLLAGQSEEWTREILEADPELATVPPDAYISCFRIVFAKPCVIDLLAVKDILVRLPTREDYRKPQDRKQLKDVLHLSVRLHLCNPSDPQECQ